MELASAVRHQHALLGGRFRKLVGSALKKSLMGRSLVPITRFLHAAALAEALLGSSVEHLHAHIARGATEVAMLASELTGLPFSFTAHAGADAGERLAIMGDETPFRAGMTLRVTSPADARFELYRNGRRVDRSAGHIRERRYPAAEPGVYRVELQITDTADGRRLRPWIYSNPIYVRPSALR